MEVPVDLHCVYTAEVFATDDSEYIIPVPERELEQGTVSVGGRYRIVILSADGASDHLESTSDSAKSTSQASAPPVSEGETREVDIESLGDQGDGIAKIERGFVIIVPDTGVGERVTIEIADVRLNVAFAEVVDQHHEI